MKNGLGTFSNFKTIKYLKNVNNIQCKKCRHKSLYQMLRKCEMHLDTHEGFHYNSSTWQEIPYLGKEL